MMFGAVAATALTLIAVPLLYYELFRDKPCPLAKGESRGGLKKPDNSSGLWYN
jgi:hypothetical protein